MSWEGYGIRVCKNGCVTYFDQYENYFKSSEDLKQPTNCPKCGAEIVESVLIDEPNGDDEYNDYKIKEMEKLSEKLKFSSIEAIQIYIKDLNDQKNILLSKIKNINSEIANAEKKISDEV